MAIYSVIALSLLLFVTAGNSKTAHLATFSDVSIFKLDLNQGLRQLSVKPYVIRLNQNHENQQPTSITLQQSPDEDSSGGEKIEELTVTPGSFVRQLEEDGLTALVQLKKIGTFYLRFGSKSDCQRFASFFQPLTTSSGSNAFDTRTETTSSQFYFKQYAQLGLQQTMLQDYIRTTTYQNAILWNPTDFNDAVVLDVGTGSGILSFFAIQAGARKAYAVEASSIAKMAEKLAEANGLLSGAQNRGIQVIQGKMEEIQLPEKVDVIISEPLGFMLLNERMLETFLFAKKWLKPNGRIFPSEAILFVAPFSDESLFSEVSQKAYFWNQQNFHGVNLSPLYDDAVGEFFRQVVIDTFDARLLMARPERAVFDFRRLNETDLGREMEVPLKFVATTSNHIHGLAFWFDAAFTGTDRTVWLSTSPTEPATHWMQVRCLFKTPIFARIGETVEGRLVMTPNKKQSYDISIELQSLATEQKVSNMFDLESAYFRQPQTSQTPPGNHHISPTEQFFWGGPFCDQNVEDCQHLNKPSA